MARTRSAAPGGTRASSPFDDEADRHILTMGVGTEDWAGEWKLRIGELVGFDEVGEQVRVPGPWEFSFTVP
jgi:hypothetical protein